MPPFREQTRHGERASAHRRGPFRYDGAMRTLAALVFIAGVAALAIALMQTPTVADGRAVAVGLLEDVRKDGVVAMECDPHIPIGLSGAAFRCIATLTDGATQVVDYRLKPDGQYEAKPHAPTRDPRPSGSPRAADPRDRGP